jgi:hypothetical protein
MLEDWTIKKEDSFLDTVYDFSYYPDFLRGIVHIDHSVVRHLMEDYVEDINPQPTKHIEANYMIDPIITPSKK